jgi:hypothetical protein
MFWIFGILSLLFWPIVIIGLIVFFVRRRRKRTHPATDKEWYLQFALSKEDAVSQLFLLLAVIFLGVTLLAFNRDLGDPFSWRAILFITSVIGLTCAYYFKVIYTLILSLVGIASWWGAQAAEWIQGKDIKASVILAGLSFIALLFYSLGHAHEREMKFKRFALVYLVLGIISITGTLFFLSTKPGLVVFGEMTRGASFLGSWQITFSLLAFLAFLTGTTLYSAGNKLMSPFEVVAVSLLALLFGVIALLPEQNLFLQPDHFYGFYEGWELSSSGVLWAIIFNAIIFFELLGVIFSGYLRRETWLINLGALFLFLLIIVKYFDWFFTFLDKSVFFIGAGILLFVVGWFMEKGRRYMISNIKMQSQQVSQ